MKKLIFLIIFLFYSNVYAADSFDSFSSSKFESGNVSQQTGGNYIYAENGKLTFNLDPSIFESRIWKYDLKSDSVISVFEANLPLKTKNSSEFYGYEISNSGQIQLVAYYKTAPAPYLMKPVYKKGMEGRKVQVWLPAASWVVRIVGAIATEVVPPIITRCLTNAKCVAIAATISGHVCAINFLWGPQGLLRKVGFPKGICEQAEEEGWVNDGNGNYTKNKKYKYHAEISGSSLPNGKPFDEKIGAYSVDELKKKLIHRCNQEIGKHHLLDEQYITEGAFSEQHLEGDVIKVKTQFRDDDGNFYFTCSRIAKDNQINEEFNAGGFNAVFKNEELEVQEKLTMVDLKNITLKDFKKNPTPYVNDNGQVGKELREKVKSSAAIQKKDGTSGTLNLTSEPYKKDDGTVSQDNVTITTGISGGVNGVQSNSYIPTGNNSVNVRTIDRPDLHKSAKPAENNSPNGLGLSNGGNNLNGGSSGGNNLNGGSSGGNNHANDSLGECEKNKSSLGCIQVGSIDNTVFNDIDIPHKTDNKTWLPDNFLPANGFCPVPKIFHVLGKEYQIGYEPICKVASDIRFSVLIAFSVMSALVVFGGFKKG